MPILIHPSHQSIIDGNRTESAFREEILLNLQMRLLHGDVRLFHWIVPFFRAAIGVFSLIVGLTLFGLALMALIDGLPKGDIAAVFVSAFVGLGGYINFRVAWFLLNENFFPRTRLRWNYHRLLKSGTVLAGTVVGIEELDGQIHLVYEFNTPKNLSIICRYQLTDAPPNRHELLNIEVCILYLTDKLNILL